MRIVKSKFFQSRYPHQQWTQTLLQLTMASSGSWPPNYIILTCTYIDRQICILSSPNSFDPDTAQYLQIIVMFADFLGKRSAWSSPNPSIQISHQQWTQTLPHSGLIVASSASWPPNYIILACTYTPTIYRQICILYIVTHLH